MIWRAVRTTLLAQLLWAASLHAQPWVPPEGQGTVSITYQNYYVVGHYDVQGRTNTNGATHAKAVMAEVDFGLSDTVGLTITLPYIATKYTGPEEYIVGGHPVRPGPLDDRRYHGTFQDVRIELRRVWGAGSIAFAPLVGISVPTHDYETRGEAVAGRHRRELQIGATAGSDLHRILPRTYVHGTYALAIGERLGGFSSVKSHVDVDAGFDLSPRIAVRGVARWQIRHQGPTIAELFAHDWLDHDRFMVASSCNLGGGMTVSLTRDAELHAVWLSTVSGNNGAHRARMLAVGATWSFGSGMGGFGSSAALNDERSPSNRLRAGF